MSRRVFAHYTTIPYELPLRFECFEWIVWAFNANTTWAAVANSIQLIRESNSPQTLKLSCSIMICTPCESKDSCPVCRNMSPALNFHHYSPEEACWKTPASTDAATTTTTVAACSCGGSAALASRGAVDTRMHKRQKREWAIAVSNREQ